MEQARKSIMVTWDFSAVSENALKHGIKLANIVKNDILLYHIAADEEEKATASTKLEAEVKRIREAYKIEANFVVEVGKIFDEISDFASNEDNNIHMVVMGTHGIKGNQKFFGSWALKVIVGSAVPFIVVQDAPSGDDRYSNVVFPLDFRSENKEKLQWAIFMGKYLNSKIHLFKAAINDKDLHKKMNVNLNFAIRFLIQNNIEYEIHSGKKLSNLQKEVLAFSKEISADMILITTTKHITSMNYIFGAKEQYLIANEERIPVMCVNPKSNFAKVGQFMYG
ncbi:MAG: universal stress protein UspA [Bacteroidetes bacterium]|nr:MAG: universal stress protein UspA [Bacteroidota bacterium]